MRVLVTGATGFLGKRVVRRLLAAGQEVRCLVRPQRNIFGLLKAIDDDSADRLQVHRGSLTRPDSLIDVAEGCDTVCHLAASKTGGAAVLFQNNVVGTRHLIASLASASVRRFVLVSSLAVCDSAGRKRKQVLDENTPIEPNPHLRDAYTYSKVVQEQLANRLCEEQSLPLVVVRPGVIYGPGGDFVTSRVGLRQGGLLLRMGGRQPLPYTYVDNCAEAVARAITCTNIDGTVFNIVDDSLPNGRYLVRRYRRHVGRLHVVPIPTWAISPLSKLSEWYHQFSDGQLPAVLTRYRSRSHWKPLRYSNEKAKAMLGWRPMVSLEEGLDTTVASLRCAAEGQTHEHGVPK